MNSAAATNTKLAFSASANADGINWDVTVAAATTTPLLPGNWKWQAYAEQGAERYTVDVGFFVVEPDLAGATAGTQQSHNEKMLAAIQSVLSGRATNDIESYSIAGRAVNKIPIKELATLETIYIAKVRAERNPGTFGVMHETHFVRPS